MTQHIDILAEIATHYDAVVLDQWGVLHNGSTPYAGAISCLSNLAQQGVKFAVLSNSGKRAAPNLERIASMGFDPKAFVQVMTSGEALWRDIDANRIQSKHFFAIERGQGDAKAWAQGLNISFTVHLDQAEAILLMGLPDGAELSEWEDTLSKAKSLNLPFFCSNPDRASPRADGLVVSPGALAYAYLDMGGEVLFYGKPHKPIFETLEHTLGTSNLLMVGDSLEHDIAGAQNAGWDSLLVRGGLYANEFGTYNYDTTLARLAQEKGCELPTYSIGELS